MDPPWPNLRLSLEVLRKAQKPLVIDGLRAEILIQDFLLQSKSDYHLSTTFGLKHVCSGF